MIRLEEDYDIVVCGGGLAGLSAAVAAAREGMRVCLIQDRPVLGGNSSSEIRVTPHGAAACHAYARETGIISELLIEERARNHQETLENGGMNSVWDMIMYDLAMTTVNLTLHLNTSIVEVVMSAAGSDGPALTEAHVEMGYHHRPACNTSDRISAVRCNVNHAEVELTVFGKIFIDASGDGIVADLAGCEWRMGTESRAEFGEPHGLPEASTGVMGSSIHFRTRDMGRPCSYQAPVWAVEHRDPKYFQCYKRSLDDSRGGYWWFEISAPWNTIHDNEKIRHELTRHVLGVWDWMKNRDPQLKESLRNYALDWIGQVPGKRESRRIMGRHLLTENDVLQKRAFPDEIAFGGWYVDLHEPGGLLLNGSEPRQADEEVNPRTYCGPYGIPLRMLLSKDVGNLLLAGRNISATHAALGTVRVMGTTALTGQAAGVAAATALKRGCELKSVPEAHIDEVQQALLRSGCFLLSSKNQDPLDIALKAQATASSEMSFVSAEPWSTEDEALRAQWMRSDRLAHLRSQWIAVSSDHLNSVGFFLTNTADSPQALTVRLLKVDHIWDYRLEDLTAATLVELTLTVPAAYQGWMDWPCDLAVPSGGYLRLDLLTNPNLVWHTAASSVPEYPGAHEFVPGQMQRWRGVGTSSLRVTPAQAGWPASRVLSGVTRPYHTTNTWRSDICESPPQWLELRWNRPVHFARVELTFPGNLFHEHHKYPPFWSDAQIPADYMIQVMRDGIWHTEIQIEGNYQRQRQHNFDQPVSADRLRVLVSKTGGDASAAIAEIRCYAEA
jgi:hypothetical protein